MHNPGQRNVPGLNYEVDMVVHQAKSMYPAAKPFDGILENQVKAIPVLVGKENRVTGITAKDNVVHGRRKMYAGFTCHAGRLTTNIQKSSLTPEAFPEAFCRRAELEERDVILYELSWYVKPDRVIAHGARHKEISSPG